MYQPALMQSAPELLSANAVILDVDRHDRQVQCSGFLRQAQEKIQISRNFQALVKAAISRE